MTIRENGTISLVFPTFSGEEVSWENWNME
jgi:hypothetical protein